MISVKGIRSNAANAANPDRHELNEQISAYRLPAMVALMLASLMLYLRSFLPVRAEVAAADEAGKPANPEADARHGPVDMPVEVAEGLDDATRQQAHHAPDADGDDDYAGGATALRGRGNASQQDANVLRDYELSAFNAFVRPANTNDPDMPRDSFQNFPVFTSNRAGSLGNGSNGGSNGGGNDGGGSDGGGSNGGSDSDGPDDDVDDIITPPARNRAPRNNGPVYLADVAAAATLVIALSDLLRNSTDPDGDTLSVRNLRSTSGTVAEQPDGTWLFTPSLTNLGRVIFSFEVWDGLIAVPQHAYSMVTGTPIIGDGDDTGPGGDPDPDDVCEGGGGVTGYNPVIGDAADNLLIGTDGNDIIRGYAGNDSAYGGNGDDWIYGGSGRDMLSGGAGQDQLYGEADEDVLEGNDGDDLLDGGGASDALFGGAGDDALFGGDGDDLLDAGAGNDQLSGGSGTDEMLGNAGNDIFFGDAGTDLLLGGAGLDILDGGADADALHGGDDADVLIGAAGDDALAGDAGADLLQGGDGHDSMAGGDGADAIYGGAGDDAATGDAGDDLLAGGDGADDLSGGTGDDSLDGGACDDLLAGGDGADMLDGGTGDDSLQGDAGHDDLTGRSGDDNLVGGAGDDTLSGGTGDDTLLAGTGDDLVTDGAGADLVMLAAGDDWFAAAIDITADTIDGGDGADTLDYSAATESVAFNLVAAYAAIEESAADTITDFESFIGGSGDDHFIVADTPAVLTGGEGDDRFEFVASDAPPPAIENLFQITDFEVGDRVSISRFDFFKDLAEELETQMEAYFSPDGNSGPGNNDPKIRFRHENDQDGEENTWIEIDFDRDNFFETTISMHGHHLFVVVENNTTPI